MCLRFIKCCGPSLAVNLTKYEHQFVGHVEKLLLFSTRIGGLIYIPTKPRTVGMKKITTNGQCFEEVLRSCEDLSMVIQRWWYYRCVRIVLLVSIHSLIGRPDENESLLCIILRSTMTVRDYTNRIYDNRILRRIPTEDI